MAQISKCIASDLNERIEFRPYYVTASKRFTSSDWVATTCLALPQAGAGIQKGEGLHLRGRQTLNQFEENHKTDWNGMLKLYRYTIPVFQCNWNSEKASRGGPCDQMSPKGLLEALETE